MDGKTCPKECEKNTSRIHWTAYLSISLCLIAGICFSLDTYLSSILGLLPLGFVHLSVYLFLICPLPALILGIVGRYRARKPLWKEGRLLATLSLVIGSVLLIMEIAIVVTELP
ncbi:hypothetical protein [Dictyobacter formicarum]|uniref:DUF4190 domain-containing protein n=1 Tax=Dictyobacter formicarum TaxID=2778368 RepID=A0ABQ3VKY3_9CHLR|nr:hypothetical protein [Dictyobacter formicarum]GHO86864.1 hypothetical protein KSZ_48700 [Dictyobacter formicarum]